MCKNIFQREIVCAPSFLVCAHLTICVHCARTHAQLRGNIAYYYFMHSSNPLLYAQIANLLENHVCWKLFNISHLVKFCLVIRVSVFIFVLGSWNVALDMVWGSVCTSVNFQTSSYGQSRQPSRPEVEEKGSDQDSDPEAVDRCVSVCLSNTSSNSAFYSSSFLLFFPSVLLSFFASISLWIWHFFTTALRNKHHVVKSN